MVSLNSKTPQLMKFNIKLLNNRYDLRNKASAVRIKVMRLEVNEQRILIIYYIFN